MSQEAAFWISIIAFVLSTSISIGFFIFNRWYIRKKLGE